MTRRTGFPPAVRDLITERAQGMCERCTLYDEGAQLHHRRPRGMGSTRRPDTNRASGGLLLCRQCHADTESNRTEALKLGLLVPQSKSPAEVPVWLRGRWVLLDDLGHYIAQEVPWT